MMAESNGREDGRVRQKVPWLWRSFLIVTGAVILVSLVLNIAVTIQKTRIENNLSVYLGQPVSFGSIVYFPPHCFILNDISFRPSSRNGRTFSFRHAQKAKVFFPLSQFISGKGFKIARVYIYEPTVVVGDYGLFFRGDTWNGLFGRGNGGVRDFSVVMRKALFSPKRNKAAKNEADVIFEVSGNNLITSYGRIELGKTIAFGAEGKASADDNFLEFSFSGYRANDGINIENLELRKSSFYAKFWGIFQRKSLHLNGILSFSNLIAAVNFPERLRRIAAGSEDVSVSRLCLAGGKSFDIFDLDCLAKIDADAITIEKLTFSLQDIPYDLNGVIRADNDYLLDFQLSSPPAAARAGAVKTFDSRIFGNIKAGKFSGDMHCSFLRGSQGRHPERLAVRFNDLSVTINLLSGFRLFLPRAKIYHESGKNISSISLKDFVAVGSSRGDFKFSSYVHDGFLRTKGKLDFKRGLSLESCSVMLAGADAGRLANLAPFFRGFYGRYDASAVYNSRPYPSMRGDFSMRNGRLERVIFFNRLSNLFLLPSLKNIGFDRFKLNFVIKDRAVDVEQVKLDSTDLKLSGNFRVSTEGLVSSRLTLALSKNILIRSSKFQPLFDLIDKKSDFLDFDFQLSGSREAVNFKWLDSDFKKKIRAALPGIAKGYVERRIEDLVAKIGK